MTEATDGAPEKPAEFDHEARLAWDGYASAMLSRSTFKAKGDMMIEDGMAERAAKFADAMLVERAKRFGDGCAR